MKTKKIVDAMVHFPIFDHREVPRQLKTKKIVSVKFDDGIELKVDGLRHLKSLIEFLENEYTFDDLGGNPDEKDRQWLRRHKKVSQVVTKSDNAAGPRNSVTKADLIAFREQYIKNREKKGFTATSHGWKAAACRKKWGASPNQFKITAKTLNERIKEDAKIDSADEIFARRAAQDKLTME